MKTYNIHLHYTPTGKWVFVGSVPTQMEKLIFDTLSKAKKWALLHDYDVASNGKLIKQGEL